MATDQGLIQRAIVGDERAMRQLWSQHAPHIDAVVRRLVGDLDEAADIAQEVWIQIFRALPTYRGDSQFGTWAHRIAVNRTLNALRRTRRLARLETDIEEDTASVEHGGDRSLLAATIEDAASKLSPGARTVFMMHDVEGFTHEEIAEELGITAGGSKSQLFKARVKLRKLRRTSSMDSSPIRIVSMLHLPIERIAELVDESATASDREHLAVCASCARELVAYRKLVAIAADERRRIAPPLTNWESLSGALRAEGLLAPAGVAPAAAARGAPLHLLRRAAAVLVLIGGGAVLGRVSAGLGVVDAVAFNTPAVTDSASPNDGDAQLASNESAGFASMQDALASLERAQRAYEMAASYIAAHDTTTYDQAPEQYRTRLAALDRTAETMNAALHDAPQDPLINQYLVATLGAREQTLRRLGTTLPVGNRLIRR